MWRHWPIVTSPKSCLMPRLREIDLRHPALVSHGRVYNTLTSHTHGCMRQAPGDSRSIYPSLGFGEHFWRRQNGPVTSQSTGLIKWPFYSWNSLETCGHIDACHRVLVDGIDYLEPHKRPVRRHKGTYNSTTLPYLDEDGGTTATHWLSRCFLLKYAFYRWTRQRIHNNLSVVDRCLRLMGDKTIPDSAELRLDSFYPPFVAGIDLLHQEVVSYRP